jgi:hypothetical protein
MTPQIVTFRASASGAEMAWLGAHIIGAVAENPGGRFGAHWNIDLPSFPTGWRPARSLEDARQRLSAAVAEWLEMAGCARVASPTSDGEGKACPTRL